MERRGQKTLYEKTSRASVSYIRGKEADIGWGKKLARKLNGPGRETSRNDILSWLCLLHFNFAPLENYIARRISDVMVWIVSQGFLKSF